MNQTFLLTGGNMGDRLHNLQQAKETIEKRAGTIEKASSIYETAAWGLTGQPSFLNQVLLISTVLPADDLLQIILQTEQQLGRKRVQKMGPRIIDIDILFYNNDVISTPSLTVPHPHIAARRFVLTPLCEIAAGLLHPVLKKTIEELLAICPDMLKVVKYSRQ